MILVRKRNYRNVSLFSLFNGESIGVYRSMSIVEYLPFLGYTEVSHARQNRLAKPVRLEISYFYLSEQPGSKMDEIPPGRYVQGCETPLGVYAVVDSGQLKFV